MRTFLRATLFSALALCIVGATAMVTAEGDNLQVSFYDEQGDLLIGVTVQAIAMDGAGTTMTRAEYQPSPDGIYDIQAAPGQRVIFDVWDSNNQQYTTVKLQVPDDISGTLPVTVNGVPGNDDCANATALSIGDVVAGSTTGGSVDAAPECPVDQGPAATVTAPGVWYTVVGNGSQLNATTCPTVDPAASATYDTKISVYCLGCETLACVDANDDQVGCSQSFRSNATWCSEDGIEYHILVHGFQSQTGDFNMSVFDNGPCTEAPADCTPPEPSGACCNCLAEPFNCQQLTESECAAQTANLAGQPGIGFQGDGSACFTTGTNTVSYSSSPNAFINSGAGTSDSIVVPDTFLIGDLDVGLVVTHTWVGDLVVSLSHDTSGTSVTLIDRPGVPAISPCGCGADNYDIVLDDSGTGGPIEDLCGAVTNPPSPPNYTPNNPLAGFGGEVASGSWTLTVVDGEPTFDDGTLNSWTLTFTDGTPTCSEFTGGGSTDPGNGDCTPGDNGQVTICHVPPGNPGNAHTITINDAALSTHLGHGDTCGACDTDGGDDGQWDSGVDAVGQSGSGIQSVGFSGQNGADQGERRDRIGRVSPRR